MSLALPTVGTSVSIRDASEWQEAAIRDVLAWEELPPLQRPIEIRIAEITFGWCTGFTMSPPTSRAELEYVFLHEYGHVWDCQQLSFVDRRFLLACLDWDCLTLSKQSWRSPTILWNERPVEQFADMFARIIQESHYRGTRYNTWSTFSEPLISRMIVFRTNFPNR